jgi:universal stress protein A
MTAYHRVLLAVDLTEDSFVIARRAQMLSAALSADVEILHVVAPPPVGTPIPPEPVVPVVIETLDERIKLAEQRLEGLAADLGVPSTTWMVEVGDVKTEIVRVARKREADLIVVGSHERHGLSAVFDFVEDAVLHKAPCDVLAIRVSHRR